MVAPAVEAAVQSALANQQYGRIAAILDAAELEVKLATCNCAAALSLRSGSNQSPCMRAHCLFCVCVSQSSNPNVLQEWPHAIHVLGLIYNQQL